MKENTILAQVVAADYSASGEHHNPACTIENLKRQDKILAKLKQAGVTEEELDFILDY